MSKNSYYREKSEIIGDFIDIQALQWDPNLGIFTNWKTITVPLERFVSMTFYRHFGVVELRVDWGDPIDKDLDGLETEEEKLQRLQEIAYYLAPLNDYPRIKAAYNGLPYEPFLLSSQIGTSMWLPCPRSEILENDQNEQS